MFETGVRQFRMAMSMVWGRRIDPGNVARLVDDLLATIAEFGEPGADAQDLLGSPLADPEERRDLAERGLRRTARRLATAFHRSTPGGWPVRPSEPAKLDMAGLAVDPGDHQAGPGRPAGRLPVHGRSRVSHHAHHRHHRAPGGDLAVPL